MQFLLAPFRLVPKVLEYRELLLNFTLKEMKIRYKQSLLGIAWALFVPVSMMLIFTFVFKRVAKVDLPTGGDNATVPYAVFAYCGLLPWTFFAQSLSGAVSSLVTNRQLVTKIYFPREVFPISKMLACGIDFAIAGVVLAVMMIAWRFPVGPAILLVPVFLLLQILFTLGCGMLLSMANLFYRDVQYVFQVTIQLWMFATAVVYPISRESVGEGLYAVLRLNPMTPIIDAYRHCLLYGKAPPLQDRAQYLFAERI